MFHIILCAADHGVAAENVSAFPQSITKTMVRNYLEYKGAALNAFAAFINAPIIVADLGMTEKFFHNDLIDLSVRRGTNNISKGAAMSEGEARLAVDNGRILAKMAISKGAKYILPAEMGIANTTSSAAMSSVLLNLPPEKVTGRGTNISDEKLLHKINIVNQAVTINKVNYNNHIEILARLGGFELAAITGIILEAAENNIKIILDGLNSTVPALIASRIESNVKNILIPSHLAGEAAHSYLLKELGLTPYFDLDFHLGEACGSSIMAKCIEIKETGTENLLLNNNCNVLPIQNTTPTQRKSLREAMQNRFLSLSMPHHALGALEEIAMILAENFGTINIKENIPLNKNWLSSIGVTAEKYLINEKRLPHFAEVLTRVSLYIFNRMKTFDEAKILG